MKKYIIILLAIVFLSSNVYASFGCYQESANIATSCGGLSTGSYSSFSGPWNVNSSSTIDGDWSTFGANDITETVGDSSYNVTYTLPYLFNNTPLSNNLEIKVAKNYTSNIIANISINETCYSGRSSIKLKLISRLSETQIYCFNSTDGEKYQYTLNGNLNSTPYGHWIYEEAMVWNMNTYNLNNLSYNTSTYESNSETIILNITLAPGITGQATLKYNNTNYTTSVSYDGLNYIYSTTLNTPQVNDNLYKYFNYTILLSDGSVIYTSTYSQYITTSSINICDGKTYNNTLINFTAYDINTDNKINLSVFQLKLDYRLNAQSLFKEFVYSNSSVGNPSIKICSDNNSISISYYTNAELLYKSNSYAQNSYYHSNRILNNITTEQKLYLINESADNLINTDLRIVDYLQKGLPNYYFYIYKYEPGVALKLLTIEKSNYDGYGSANLIWYNDYYKFVIVNGSTTVKSYDPFKITYEPQVFKIDQTDTYPLDKFKYLEYSLTFNNVSKTFYLSFNDPNNEITAGCLRVVKAGLNYTTLSDQCLDATNGILTYTTTETNGTLYGQFYAKGSYSPIYSLYVYLASDSTLYDLLGNKESSWLSMLIIGTLTILAMALGPTMAVITAVLSYVGVLALGLQPPSMLTSFIAIIIFAAYLIWRLNE